MSPAPSTRRHRKRRSGSAAADCGFVDDVPTIGGLLAEARRARDAEADVVDVAVDPADGHPMSIDIDWDRNSIDDEACYVITDFKELT